jgi:hypothetical protein
LQVVALHVLRGGFKAEAVAVSTATTTASALAHLLLCLRQYQNPSQAPPQSTAARIRIVDGKSAAASIGGAFLGNGLAACVRGADGTTGGESGKYGETNPKDQSLLGHWSSLEFVDNGSNGADAYRHRQCQHGAPYRRFIIAYVG